MLRGGDMTEGYVGRPACEGGEKLVDPGTAGG